MKTTWTKRNIPILSWLPGYNRGWLTADVIAGLTLWGLVVPEAMAYAGIAGLPFQAGLYIASRGPACVRPSGNIPPPGGAGHLRHRSATCFFRRRSVDRNRA